MLHMVSHRAPGVVHRAVRRRVVHRFGAVPRRAPLPSVGGCRVVTPRTALAPGPGPAAGEPAVVRADRARPGGCAPGERRRGTGTPRGRLGEWPRIDRAGSGRAGPVRRRCRARCAPASTAHAGAASAGVGAAARGVRRGALAAGAGGAGRGGRRRGCSRWRSSGCGWRGRSPPTGGTVIAPGGGSRAGPTGVTAGAVPVGVSGTAGLAVGGATRCDVDGIRRGWASTAAAGACRSAAGVVVVHVVGRVRHPGVRQLPAGLAGGRRRRGRRGRDRARPTCPRSTSPGCSSTASRCGCRRPATRSTRRGARRRCAGSGRRGRRSRRRGGCAGPAQHGRPRGARHPARGGPGARPAHPRLAHRARPVHQRRRARRGERHRREAARPAQPPGDAVTHRSLADEGAGTPSVPRPSVRPCRVLGLTAGDRPAAARPRRCWPGPSRRPTLGADAAGAPRAGRGGRSLALAAGCVAVHAGAAARCAGPGCSGRCCSPSPWSSVLQVAAAGARRAARSRRRRVPRRRPGGRHRRRRGHRRPGRAARAGRPAGGAARGDHARARRARHPARHGRPGAAHRRPGDRASPAWRATVRVRGRLGPTEPCRRPGRDLVGQRPAGGARAAGRGGRGGRAAARGPAGIGRPRTRRRRGACCPAWSSATPAAPRPTSPRRCGRPG